MRAKGADGFATPFTVPASALQIWDASSSSWITGSGAYAFSVGGSSASLPLSATYTINGE
jgi:hypothetical protein